MNNKNPYLESLLEYSKFFEVLDHRQLQSILPEQFQAHVETIYQVKGSSFCSLILKKSVEICHNSPTY